MKAFGVCLFLNFKVQLNGKSRHRLSSTVNLGMSDPSGDRMLRRKDLSVGVSQLTPPKCLPHGSASIQTSIAPSPFSL